MIELIQIELSQMMQWIIGLLVGGLAGFVYFYGLWLTLKQLPLSKNPGLWILFSLLLRMAFVMSVFYLLIRTIGWQGLLAALVGLTLMRYFISRLYKPDSNIQESPIDPIKSI